MKIKQKRRHALLLANFTHIFGLSMLAPVYALFGLCVGATPLQIGLTWALYNLVAGVINIVGGRMEDGSQRNRRLIIAGYLITALGVGCFLFVKEPSQLYIAQIISAVGVGLYMPAWKSAYSKSQDKNKLASQWGLFDGTNMIAMAGAALLAGWLVNCGYYQELFISIIGLYILSSIFAFHYR